MKYKKYNHGTATLSTLLILFGILAIALIGIEIMLSGFRAYMHQGASNIAYYAAESGIERTLIAYKNELKFFHDPPIPNNCNSATCPNFNCKINFSSMFCTTIGDHPIELEEKLGDVEFKADPPKYEVKVKVDGRDVELRSLGSYLNTNREILVRFCVPDCDGKLPGDPDGCEGVCLN